MKKIIWFILVAFIFFSCNQEENKPTADTKPKPNPNLNTRQQDPYFTPPDPSPMDLIYFPQEYSKLKAAFPESPPPVMRIIYSRPQKLGRKIFGELVKYNVPWRLGANESTEIEFFYPVKIQDQTVKPGRYILYCIPQETKWTIILNSNLYSWGLKQNKEMDVYQFDISLEKNNAVVELFTMVFEKTTGGADLLFLWDDIKTKLPVTFNIQ